MVYKVERPEVTSPLARGVLAAVANKQPPLSFYDDGANIDTEQTRQAQYRKRIREQLKRSGLALLIPAGEGLVPDITTAMPQPWRTLARVTRPRTHAQLAVHIMRHLNWYADPNQPAIMPFKLHQAAASLAILLLIVSWRLVPMLLDYMYEFWIPGLALAFALLGGLLLWIATAQADGTFMDRANRSEFYRYLCNAYRDPPEPRPSRWEAYDAQQREQELAEQPPTPDVVYTNVSRE